MEDIHRYTDFLDRRVSLVKKNNQLEDVVISLFRPKFKLSDDSIRLAVIGDLHGHITLALERLKQWVNYSNRPVNCILQVGDIGAFNEQSVLDKTTLEMAQKDPKELGFLDYIKKTDEADQFFGEKGFFNSVPLYFIDGNHDDISFLEKEQDHRENGLGPYEEICYLPSGKSLSLSKDDIRLNISGLGYNHKKNDVKKIAGQNMDVLLTHLPPCAGSPESEPIRRIIQLNPPRYHFFGHVHEKASEHSSTLKNTYGLNEVKQKSNGDGSIGILEIQKDKDLFFYIPNDI